MSNPFYNKTGNPQSQSRGLSSQMRNEFALVEQGFDAVAPINSPAFTGTPTAPTPTAGTSNTAIATTAFVMAAALDANIPGQTGNAGKFLGTDGTNASWQHAPSGYLARTSNTELGVSGRAKFIDVTSGTFTQTFAAAATLGDGWYCYVRNAGSGAITLDPAGSELIDGLTTATMPSGQATTRIIQCNGTAFFSVIIPEYVSPSTSGNVLKSNGTAWVSSPDYVSAEAIGSYVIGWGGTVTSGQSVAGSSVQIINPNIGAGAPAGGSYLSGTWRAMTATPNSNYSTLFQRIA